MMNLPPFQATHRHCYGAPCELLHAASCAQTGRALVVYRGADGAIWARPLSIFGARLPDGRLRYEPLPNHPATAEGGER
jgi:hypothetical protein